MALRIVFAEAEALAVAVDVLQNVVVLMSLEPAFFPVKRDGFRAGWAREERWGVGRGFGGAGAAGRAHNKKCVPGKHNITFISHNKNGRPTDQLKKDHNCRGAVAFCCSINESIERISRMIG